MVVREGVRVFDQQAPDYDRWFDEHPGVYNAEVEALRTMMPPLALGVEIGVGTGRFARPLGIRMGVEPARRMAQLARKRGLSVCQAMGERLPFRDSQFDVTLFVTVICFVDDVPALFREARRVLQSGGHLILGFIDRDSPLGQGYEMCKETSTFYRAAHFRSVAQVAKWVREAGFDGLRFCQTLLDPLGEGSGAEKVRPGHGDGAFVVLSARKPEHRGCP